MRPWASTGPRLFLFVWLAVSALGVWLGWRQGWCRPLLGWLAAIPLLVFVHARGATSLLANQWSALPVNVDQARWRVWDWKDAQFLRGLD